MGANMRTIDWVPGPRAGHIRLIDQTRLPGDLVELEIRTTDQLVDAIARLAVRGAPALGVAGAMGVALAVATLPDDAVEQAVAALRAARPTAVNRAAATRRWPRRSDSATTTSPRAGRWPAAARTCSPSCARSGGRSP